ncbi:MAG: hypothetical protein JO061_22410 [Acidobacteriaceae bacterium]|nr:hypothetical protein [Acidobacteriaceae bacterium]
MKSLILDSNMAEQSAVWLNTPLMVLSRLENMGPLHAYGLAWRVRQVSGGSR